MNRRVDPELLRRFAVGDGVSLLKSSGYTEAEIDGARELVLWGALLPAPGVLGGGGGGLGLYGQTEGLPTRKIRKSYQRDIE